MKQCLIIITLLLFTSYIHPEELPKWEKGYFDIHFISTGKGNSAFYIFPDGTTMLIDAGDLPGTDSVRRSPAVPNNSKTPGQWIADYINQFFPTGKKAVLDYALVTHYHDDHFGHFDNTVKVHPEGGYKLSGITEVGSIIPIKVLLDRGMDYPFNFTDTVMVNRMKSGGDAAGLINDLEEYRKFIKYQEKTNGLINRKFLAGSSNQISITDTINYPGFKVKNLFANGEIASLWGDSIGYRKFKEGEYPGENNLSCGLKISYGKFDLYTGADIPGISYTGSSDFQGMDALAAPVIGPVDVATLNHHGNRDSQSEYFVRTICPRVWIGQSWTSNHPGEEVLRRITSRDVYPGERDLFTNFLAVSNKVVLGKRGSESYKSETGHIVIRVAPGGETYEIFILNDKAGNKEIMAHYHYTSR